MIVPTRNRAHTLEKVAPSYFSQELVTEIIFVDDCGEDRTSEVVTGIAAGYPQVTCRVVRNPARRGASQSRNVGVKEAVNDYILFCDDDEYLEAGYAKTCLDKLIALNAGAVSGRRIYMQDGETQAQALARFGDGPRRTRKIFRPVVCEYVNAANFTGDHKVPITNAIIVTRKDLLLKFPYDSFYARGNGYREETDYQMNLFVNGYDIVITNEKHSLHLPMSEVRTGGQRVRPLRRLLWSIYYNHYFYGKYYAAYAKRLGIKTPRFAAEALFTFFVVQREGVRVAMWGRDKGRNILRTLKGH